MPRQRTRHSRITYAFPDAFPDRLKRFQKESALPWAELRRRLDVDRETLRRWRDRRALPSTRNYVALLVMADSFGLGHLFRVLSGKARAGTRKARHTRSFQQRAAT